MLLLHEGYKIMEDRSCFVTKIILQNIIIKKTSQNQTTTSLPPQIKKIYQTTHVHKKHPAGNHSIAENETTSTQNRIAVR